MKQSLLTATIIVFATNLLAQSRTLAPATAIRENKANVAAQDPSATALIASGQNTPSVKRKHGVNTTNTTVTLVPIGSTSFNAYTGHESKLHPLAYDPATNLLVLAHRGGAWSTATPPAPINTATNTGNQVHIDISSNGGATWTAQVPFTNPSVAPATPNYNTRYPNVCIWNPTGNTNPANAKAVVAGPATTITGTAGAWSASYLAWANLPNITAPNYTFQTAIPSAAGQIDDLPQGMTNLNNGFGYLSSRLNVSAQRRDFIYALIDFWKITPNGTGGFTRSLKFTSAPIACPAPVDTANLGFDLAFGPDGNTGYITHRTAAIDAQKTLDYNRSPVLYKTTDAGETWTRQPTLDLQNIQMLIDSCRNVNGDTTTIIPVITDSRLVVDNMGKCHIFAEVASAFSRCHDSLTFTVGNFGTKYFAHFIVDGNNVQTNFIFRSHNTDVDFGGLTNRGDFNEQMQAGRSADGTRIFFTASQSEPTASSTANNAPNLFAYAYRTTDNKFMPLRDFTAGTDAEATVFFPRLSPVVMNTATGHKLPITLMVPGTLAGATTVSDMAVPDFFFLDGVEVLDADYTNTGAAATTNTYTTGSACGQLTICVVATEFNKALEGKVRFMPNPSSGLLNINMTELVSAATLTVSDAMGRTISTQTNQTGIAQLDLTAQATGIYFVTVKNNEGSYTAKIVLDK